jgi:cytochrome-b5 reductase
MFRAQHILRRGGVAVAAAALLAAPVLLPRTPASSFAHAEAAAAAATATAPPPPALSPSEFRPFKLVAIEQLSPDTAKYVFALPAEDAELGTQTASVLVVKATLDGKDVMRPYTPTSPEGQRGTFELIVKAYPTGNVSKHFASLRVGDEVAMKGPFQKFKYESNTWRGVGMIAGGSGITPMFQLLQTILSNPRDKTEVRLLYASRTPADIILRAELEALAAAHPNFKVVFNVDSTGAAAVGSSGSSTATTWALGGVGHISKEQVKDFLPPPADSYKILVCGPPPFMKAYSGEKKSPAEQGELTGALAELGYTPEHVFKF